MPTTTTSTKENGFSFVELLIIIILVSSVVALLLPQFVRAKRTGGPYRSCVVNLRTASSVFQTWAQDFGHKYPMSLSTNYGGTLELQDSGAVFPHFQVLSNIVSPPKFLLCPSDTRRKPAMSWTEQFDDQNLSYFLGMDADEKKPRMLLLGDRNITGGIPMAGKIVVLKTNSPAGWGKGLHENYGNVCFADGSVEETSAQALQNYFSTNSQRLAIP